MNTLYFLFGAAVGAIVSLLIFDLILTNSKEIRFENETEEEKE